MIAAFDGLDLLMIAVVIGGVFVLALFGAFRIQDYEDELDRRFYESIMRAQRDLDRPEVMPFDWAEKLLDEIDRLPETSDTIRGLS